MTQAVNVASLGVAMTADSSGNVGVGTSSPSAKLHVAGNITVNDGQQYCFGSNNYNGMAGSAASNILQFYTNNTERARIDSSGNFQFNSGYGSVATAYGCRSWVNFNGTGTVAIRGSGNVSSITDNAVGDYTVNFSVALTDSNYTAVTGGCITNYGSSGFSPRQGPASSNITSSACRVTCGFDNGAYNDWVYVAVSIYR